MDYRNESVADVPCLLQLCHIIISCSIKSELFPLMMRERKDNGFVSSFESVAALRFEKFGKLFYESIRLEHLKRKKKKKLLHMPPTCLWTLTY